MLLQNAHPGPVQASSREGLGSLGYGHCLSEVHRGLHVHHRSRCTLAHGVGGFGPGVPGRDADCPQRGRAVLSIYFQDDCNQDPASAVMAGNWCSFTTKCQTILVIGIIQSVALSSYPASITIFNVLYCKTFSMFIVAGFFCPRWLMIIFYNDCSTWMEWLL